jgi:hypothetical protein
MMLEYKVLELSVVTDETIEEALNRGKRQGWIFDSLHFAMGTGSKRPAMAFLFFTRPLETPEESEEGKGANE